MLMMLLDNVIRFVLRFNIDVLCLIDIRQVPKCVLNNVVERNSLTNHLVKWRLECLSDVIIDLSTEDIPVESPAESEDEENSLDDSGNIW